MPAERTPWNNHRLRTDQVRRVSHKGPVFRRPNLGPGISTDVRPQSEHGHKPEIAAPLRRGAQQAVQPDSLPWRCADWCDELTPPIRGPSESQPNGGRMTQCSGWPRVEAPSQRGSTPATDKAMQTSERKGCLHHLLHYVAPRMCRRCEEAMLTPLRCDDLRSNYPLDFE